MELLDITQIKSLLADPASGLFIDPLLDQEKQLGTVTVDLRLGYDFLVSIFTRKPYIELSRSEDFRNIESYFQTTRRPLGEKFILYPNQVVLTTTIEYVALPTNVYADIISRSSYTRLGVHLNTMVQPGFRGCIHLELSNQSNNAVELVVGSRLVQMRLFKLTGNNNYGDYRKYYGNVRPNPSRAQDDPDLMTLDRISTVGQ